jgi:hypothetical protein
VDSTLRYLPFLSRARERWPTAAMLLSGKSSNTFLVELTLACLAEILVLQIFPRLSAVTALAKILPYAAGVSVMSGVRKGQLQFHDELERARFLTGLTSGDRERAYVSATSGFSLLHATLCILAAPLGVVTSLRLASGRPVDLAAAVAIALLWPAFVMLRVAAGHLATWAREFQPPQVAYLFTGVLFGLAISTSTMGHSARTRSDSGITAACLPLPALSIFLIEATIGVVAVWLMRLSVRLLTTRGPAPAPQMPRVPVGFLPQWLPLRAWVSGSRTTGSVVFGFAVFTTLVGTWIARNQGVLMHLPKLHDATELGVVLLYMGAYLGAILFAAPADLQSYACTRPLMLLARVSLQAEARRRVVVVLVPAIAICLLWAIEMTGHRPMALVPTVVLWASASTVTIGAVGVVVLPALTKRSPGFEAADDGVPLREFVTSGVGCLLPSALVVGYLTVAQRSAPEILACVGVVLATGLVLALRLCIHLSLQDRTTSP